MSQVVHLLLSGLLMAAAMAWKTAWSLVLGFAVSATLQVLVPTDRLRQTLGRANVRSVALAAAAGAASSSCSYASASIMRTLFKKGAALGPSLAFLVASTNLVLELGLVLWMLMGWRFMAAEWLGGFVLIAIVVALAGAFPVSLIDAARRHEEHGQGHDHGGMHVQGTTWRERMHNPHALPMIGQAFAMEWRMLWKDLLAGFLIAGMLSVFVPAHIWQGLFLAHAPAWLRVPADVLIGPVVAMLTFVCSIGNVPLAATLWAGGASFGGVVAFLYADLIVLPLLDTYRRYFGGQMAAAMGAALFVAVALAALVISLVFGALGWVPAAVSGTRGGMGAISLDYSFWLNLVALALAGYLIVQGRKHQGHHH